MNRLIASVSLVLVLAAGLRADDKKDAKPDTKAYMDAMMKAGTPGEAHKLLNPLEGSFEFVAKFWMDPTQSPQESKGVATHRWVMGGRFLRLEVSGDFFGMKFEGVGHLGYDNVQKKYISNWFDNFSTGMMNSEGAVDRSGKVFTYHSEEVDPLTGQKFKSREVTTLLGEGEFKSEFFKTMGGQEMKTMEIHYKRKK